jgi:Zn-dependent protease with chaperone function
MSASLEKPIWSYLGIAIAQANCIFFRLLLYSSALLAPGIAMGWALRAIDLVALGIAAWPLGWSLSGFVLPSERWLIQRRYRARQPTELEQTRVDVALAAIRRRDRTLKMPHAVLVVDASEFDAAVLGNTLLIGCSSSNEDSLEPILAHQLGHMKAHDGRMAVALIRLTILADRKPLVGFRFGRGEKVASVVHDLTSGAWGFRITTPLWAQYYEQVETRADEYAARLGYGMALASHYERKGACIQSAPFAWMRPDMSPPLPARLAFLTADVSTPASELRTSAWLEPG